MSKNNAQEYVRKMEPQRQRFGLRKLSVGVASVLLGTTFMVGGSTVAHADSTPTPTVVASSTSDQNQQVPTLLIKMIHKQVEVSNRLLLISLKNLK